MPETWVDPQDAIPGEDYPSTQYNSEVIGNIRYLAFPPAGEAERTSDTTTTSTSFADIGELTVTITTVADRDVLIGWVGSMAYSTATGNFTYLTVTRDGTNLGDTTEGLTQFDGGIGVQGPLAGCFIDPAPGAGAHTYKLQWKVSTGTATIYDGFKFFAREC